MRRAARRVLLLVPMGIEELIVSARRPQEINYKIVKYSVMPLSNHAGVVTFQEQNGSTLVLWKCTFTPSCWGIEWLLRCTISFSFNKMLSALRASFR